MKRKTRNSAGNRRSATTIREIANLAGVSTATVSRAINEPDKVLEATRRRITEVMRRHHFVADRLAGGLRSQRSRTIGLVIPTIANSIYASSTQAIQEVAQGEDYTVLIGITDYSAEVEEGLIHRLIEHRIDGLILTGADRQRRVYQKIRHNKVPYVITWQFSRASRQPTISFDNYSAARTATEHLIALGHRRIGLICGRTAVNDRAFERRRAFEDALRDHGLTVQAAWMHEREFEMSQGREAMASMLRGRRRPTAVFCANDVQAVGAIEACYHAGLAIPGDLSIIGFDDLPIAASTRPPLTTIRVPAREMGRQAAEALMDAIRDEAPIQRVELPTELVLRASTAPVR